MLGDVEVEDGIDGEEDVGDFEVRFPQPWTTRVVLPGVRRLERLGDRLYLLVMGNYLEQLAVGPIHHAEGCVLGGAERLVPLHDRRRVRLDVANAQGTGAPTRKVSEVELTLGQTTVLVCNGDLVSTVDRVASSDDEDVADSVEDGVGRARVVESGRLEVECRGGFEGERGDGDTRI